jgi:hypothetical protein
MVRHVRNPWAKKSKRGMKTLNTIGKVVGALGTAAYVEKKKSNAQSHQTSPNSFSPIGCAVIVLGLIIAITIYINTGSYLTFLLVFLGVTFLGIFVSTIIECEAKKGNTFTQTSEIAKIPNWGIEFEETKNIVKESIKNKESESIINSQISKLPLEQRSDCFLQALLSALDEYNLMSEIPDDTENYIDSLASSMHVSENTLARQKQYIEFMKALVVQDLIYGITPHRTSLTNNPLNFQKGETLIWAFVGVVLYEEVTHRQSHGASSGFSVRIAKGVYYRVGAFKGEPLITTSLQPKYSGSLIVTNKNIYFYSPQKSIRLPYNKIISFVPFEDSIGIQPDRMNAKTIYIKGIDGRFAFNIVSNIQNLED